MNQRGSPLSTKKMKTRRAMLSSFLTEEVILMSLVTRHRLALEVKMVPKRKKKLGRIPNLQPAKSARLSSSILRKVLHVSFIVLELLLPSSLQIMPSFEAGLSFYFREEEIPPEPAPKKPKRATTRSAIAKEKKVAKTSATPSPNPIAQQERRSKNKHDTDSNPQEHVSCR